MKNSELRTFATLLIYPRKPLLEELLQINEDISNSKVLTEPVKGVLQKLTAFIASKPMSAIQRVYLSSFKADSDTLNIGQNPDGSPELAAVRKAADRLQKLYQKRGITFRKDEMPDFLPAILDFLSTVSSEDARLWLKDAKPFLVNLQSRLMTLSSPWSAVLSAIICFSEQEEKELPGLSEAA